MNDPFSIRKSTKDVIMNSQSVRIVPNAITTAVTLLSSEVSNASVRKYSVQQVFLMDCVNFCFWAPKGQEKWKIEFPNGKFRDGWDGLVASFDRAIAEGVPILDASFLANISPEDVGHIFRSSTNSEIPLLRERRANLREAGDVLRVHFGGLFDNALKGTGMDAEKILEQIIKNFSSFNDQALFEGKTVYFYKRAQITVLDLAVLAGIQVERLDILTACADYKLPQLLRSLGVLEYDNLLAQKIDAMEFLDPGSREEVEIRAATVQAVELLAERMKKTPAETDNLMWNIAASNTLPMKPYHRALTTNY